MRVPENGFSLLVVGFPPPHGFVAAKKFSTMLDVDQEVKSKAKASSSVMAVEARANLKVFFIPILMRVGTHSWNRLKGPVETGLKMCHQILMIVPATLERGL